MRILSNHVVIYFKSMVQICTEIKGSKFALSRMFWDEADRAPPPLQIPSSVLSRTPPSVWALPSILGRFGRSIRASPSIFDYGLFCLSPNKIFLIRPCVLHLCQTITYPVSNEVSFDVLRVFVDRIPGELDAGSVQCPWNDAKVLRPNGWSWKNTNLELQ